MKILSRLAIHKSRGQETADLTPVHARPIQSVPPEYRPENRGQGGMLDGSAPSARGINRGGRNTPMSALAREMERARSGGVKPRAQAGGSGGPP